MLRHNVITSYNGAEKDMLAFNALNQNHATVYVEVTISFQELYFLLIDFVGNLDM